MAKKNHAEKDDDQKAAIVGASAHPHSYFFLGLSDED